VVRKRKSLSPPVVEVRAVCDCSDVNIEATRRYARAVMIETGLDRFELSILLADDAYIRALNRQYRGVDRTTNVLAFPQDANVQTSLVAVLLGDLAISVEKACRDSAAAGQSLSDELKKLVVHGILHLAGHDHRTRPQAQKMRDLERIVMERTG